VISGLVSTKPLGKIDPAERCSSARVFRYCADFGASTFDVDLSIVSQIAAPMIAADTIGLPVDVLFQKTEHNTPNLTNKLETWTANFDSA